MGYESHLKLQHEWGRQEGMREQQQAIARNLLDVLDDATSSERTGLSLEAVRHLRQDSG